MFDLKPDISINPNAPKLCFLDIDGVVVDIDKPYTLRKGVIEKVQKLKDEGWLIIAFTSRGLQSLYPLIEKGLILDSYLQKPVGREIMIIDDILSEARNQL